MVSGEADASLPAKEHHQLADHRGAAPDIGRHRRTGDAQRRKRTDAEDEARPEQNVEDVAQPQHAHRDRRITGAAEHRVEHEEQQHGRIPAEHHAS